MLAVSRVSIKPFSCTYRFGHGTRIEQNQDGLIIAEKAFQEVCSSAYNLHWQHQSLGLQHPLQDRYLDEREKLRCSREVTCSSSHTQLAAEHSELPRVLLQCKSTEQNPKSWPKQFSFNMLLGKLFFSSTSFPSHFAPGKLYPTISKAKEKKKLSKHTNTRKLNKNGHP